VLNLYENYTKPSDFVTGMYRLALGGDELNEIMILAFHIITRKNDDKGDLELLRTIAFDPVFESIIRSIINTPLGRNGYTPLCRAAWAGSERVMRFLVRMGADIEFKNTHQEDIADCIRKGKEDYTKCINYIMSEQATRCTTSHPKVKKAVPNPKEPSPQKIKVKEFNKIMKDIDEAHHNSGEENSCM